MSRLEVTAPDGLPEITVDSDLARVITAVTELADGDVVVVTSKVVSKAEGRVRPGDRGEALAEETVRVVASRGPTLIVRNRLGLTMAAAGIDASNVGLGQVALLPLDPDASARGLRSALLELTGANVGVVITDTAGRAWREGQTDIAIGAAGLVVAEDFAGARTPTATRSSVTLPAVADEIAGAAELAQGKLAGRPVAVVRGRADLVLDAGDHGTGAVRWCGPRARTCSGTAPARPSSGPWPGTDGGPPPVRRPRPSRRAGRGDRAGPPDGTDGPRRGRGRPHVVRAGAGRLGRPHRRDRRVLRPRLDGGRVAGRRFATWWPPCHPPLRRLCPRPPPERCTRAPGASPVPDPRDSSAVSKKDRTDRQAVIDSIRKKQAGTEKRRGFALVGACILVALVIIGAAAYQPIKDWWDLRVLRLPGHRGHRRPRRRTAARSRPRRPPAARTTSSPAPRSQYEDSPPAFGQHYNVWDGIERKLYSESDRPDVGELVHNLEHGYTILWYDETVADSDSMMDDLRGIASKKSSTDQPPRQVQGRAVDLRGRRALPLAASTSP